MESWIEGGEQVFILGVALGVLTLILAFQARLSRSQRAHRMVRVAFLLFTLVWLGWIAGAQLSIVHVINYLKGPFEGLSLGFYLAEPLIVLITIYTARSLLLLGRGVFCGWLCPSASFRNCSPIWPAPCACPDGIRQNGCRTVCGTANTFPSPSS